MFVYIGLLASLHVYNAFLPNSLREMIFVTVVVITFISYKIYPLFLSRDVPQCSL